MSEYQILESLLVEAVDKKLMDKFIKNAKKFWASPMSADQERILRQDRPGQGGGGELLDILADRVKGNFNGEKMKEQFGRPSIPLKEVIRRLSKESSWAQFMGLRGFKGS